MKPLSAHWGKVKDGLEERDVILFLDYDGTLAPIVRHPDDARISAARKRLLRELALTAGIKTAVVSGRSLKDLKKRIGIPGLICAGNHGLEWENRRGSFVYPGTGRWKKSIGQLAGRLKPALRRFAGVLVEDKGLTISVHYRRLLPRKIKAAQKALVAILRSRRDFSKLAVREGKKVWEIRPPVPWDKGRMVRWFLAKAAGLGSRKKIPVYIGDDRTDEDAFKVLKKRGLGIKVTRHPSEASAAGYYLCSPKEVFDFLKRLKDLKEKEKKIL